MPDASPAGTLEREVKLGAWPGFTLPPLDGVLPWVHVVDGGEQQLDALYVDTADLRLVRWGITLRHRTGEGGARWTAKLPADLGGGHGDAVLHRTEHEVQGERGEVPEGLVSLLRGFVRAAPLVPVAHLVTRRRTWRLVDAGERDVGTVDDDEVSVLEGDRIAARFREVEVEIRPGVSPTLIDALVGALQAAGAGPADPTPKLVRALGPRALAAPELVVPDPDAIGGDATVGAVVQRAIADSVLRLLVQDPGVRLDAGVEAVHQARVATRRLRSDLRTFAPVLAEGWADPLREELGWLGGVLGEVRDTDVLDARLRHALERFDPLDRQAAAPLLAQLGRRRDGALAALREAIDGERYVALLDRLVAVGQRPELAEGAARPAVEVLPSLVRKPWRKLVRYAHDLGDAPADGALHHLRILAKRARYAAEAAGVVVDDARRHGKAIAALQGVLGEHHDAVVAEQWLRSAASDLPAPSALVAGMLVAAERVEAQAARDAWPDVYGKAAAPKRRRWL